MRNRLLISTALVAVAFTAGNVLAAEVSITNESEQTLQQYAESDGAHQEWADTVAIDGVTAEVKKPEKSGDAFIQAKDLTITGSNITVDGKGQFISGDTTTKIAGGSTIILSNEGHLLGSYDNKAESDDDHHSIAIENATIHLKNGIIRGASNGNEENREKGQYASVDLFENGRITTEEGTTNFIASVATNINGALDVAKDAVVKFVGDLVKDGNYLTDEAADNKAGKVVVGESGVINNQGTIEIDKQVTWINENKLVNNGEINTGAEFFANAGYESDGGRLGNPEDMTGPATAIVIAGDIKLDNNARIIAAQGSEDEGSITIKDASTITLSNGSTIDAVDLNIEGVDGRTQITLGGRDDEAGREGEKDEDWRNDAYLVSYGDSSIKNAEIHLNDGSHIQQGTATGSGNTTTFENTIINVAEGAMMNTSEGAKFALNGVTINLNGGSLKGVIEGVESEVVDDDAESTESSQTQIALFAEPTTGDTLTENIINVNSAASSIEKDASGLDALNINTDITLGQLIQADVESDEVNVNGNFILAKSGEEDANAGSLTAEVLNVNNGSVLTVGDADQTKYAVKSTVVKDGAMLDLATKTFGGADKTVEMQEGSTLSLTIANTTTGEGEEAVVSGLVNGNIANETTINAKGAKLNIVVADGTVFSSPAEEGGESTPYTLTFSDALKNAVAEDGGLVMNTNYKYNVDIEEGTISENSAAETVSAMVKDGASASGAAIAAALSSIDSDNATAKSLSSYIDNMMQTGQAAAASKAAEDVAPSDAPVTQAVETNIMNQAYGAVAAQLSGSRIASVSEGKASGDSVFNKVSAWVRTLFSKGDVDTGAGFDVETKGVAFGVDKQVSDDVKAGLAYAYGDTEVDAARRDTDVESHTFMLYGEYKPSNWFVNGIVSYSMSDYDETKHSAVANVDGSYDVDVYGLQAMAGYEAEVGGYALTPEAGLRYAHIKQDAYTDSLGQRIDAENQDVLTAIAGVKAAKDFALESGTVLRPEARLALTYDLMDGDNSTIVNIGGTSYSVEGEELERFGVEAGLGLTAELNDNWDVSAGYEGRFRDDYTDHSGVLSAKYKF